MRVDLYTREMHLCLLTREGNKRLHRSIQAQPDGFLRAIHPSRKDLVVEVESTLLTGTKGNSIGSIIRVSLIV